MLTLTLIPMAIILTQHGLGGAVVGEEAVAGDVVGEGAVTGDNGTPGGKLKLKDKKGGELCPMEVEEIDGCIG
jgi:hypothetical protein